MTSLHDDLSGFGALGNAYGHDGLGREYTLTESGQLSPTSAAGGHGGASGGSTFGHTPPPTPTPVNSGKLTLDLVWDASVASAPSWFKPAVVADAQVLVNDLGLTTTRAVTVYIDVGWGEIAGQGMSSSALGESETNGYLVSDATLTSLLTGHGDTLGGSNAPSPTTQFFLPTGEAKALGLAGVAAGSPSSPDGYVGFSTLGKGYSWSTSGTPTSMQYSFAGVVWHELTEAMGRISMEGLQTFQGHKTYTPLDLFDYSLTTPGALSLSNAGGYFSSNGGGAPSGVFNNAKAYSGDIADWASYNSPTDSQTSTAPGHEDAFNAFGYLGLVDDLTTEDIAVMVALGY